MSDGRLPSSFRDPSGFVFTRDGVLHRQVNRGYAATYDRLMQCGLYERLVGESLLISHQECDASPADPAAVHKILQPRAVPFISHPFEWPFDALKSAALATLRIQEEAITLGMSLKDASAYNIQFVHARPVLIDTLSFEPYVEGRPWVAYQQFCKHFLAPLSLMATRDIRFGRMLQDYVDGIPLDLTSETLPRRTYLDSGLLMHLHLHARSQRRHADDAADSTAGAKGSAVKPTPKLSKQGALGILDSLRSTIQKLEWKPIATEWGAYYESTNYSDAAMQQKHDLVAAYVDRVRPAQVWDLGANTGRFSRIASARGIPTVAFDIDPVAVNANFRQCQKDNEQHLLPLILDLTNPSPAIGWGNAERASFMQRGPVDMIFALALIHHLAISNNVPLPMLARFFAQLTRALVIEFVPKEDSQVRRLLSTREDVFPDYDLNHFRRTFGDPFEIADEQRVGDSERTLFLMTRR